MKTRAIHQMLTGRDPDAGFRTISAAKQRELLARTQTERADIERRQGEVQLNRPVFDALKKSIDELRFAGLVENDTPAITKFDAYQAARAARDAQKGRDSELSGFVMAMKNEWEKDPSGNFTVGQLAGYRQSYRKMRAHSKAAQAIDEVFPKYGFGSLNVRKLAQLASEIENQNDFNILMKRARLDCDRPEQIRARAFVLECVNRRSQKDLGQIDAPMSPSDKPTPTETPRERAEERLQQYNLSPEAKYLMMQMPKYDLPPPEGVTKGSRRNVNRHNASRRTAQADRKFYKSPSDWGETWYYSTYEAMLADGMEMWGDDKKLNENYDDLPGDDNDPIDERIEKWLVDGYEIVSEEDLPSDARMASRRAQATPGATPPPVVQPPAPTPPPPPVEAPPPPSPMPTGGASAIPLTSETEVEGKCSIKGARIIAPVTSGVGVIAYRIRQGDGGERV